MVPTGSGALMYTDDDRSANGRAYSGEVYGTDAARLLLHPVENEEAICLPVFGAKTDAQNALFAVIDQGAGAAWIEALAGNSRYDYANVYARFLYRGYDEMEYSSRWESKALSAGCKSDAVYSVCYYPLKGEQADYTGMAQFYRQVPAGKRSAAKECGRAESVSGYLDRRGGDPAVFPRHSV